MKKKLLSFKILLSCFSFFLFITSCTTTKNVAYFQDLADTSKTYTQVISGTYEVLIQPDDVLEILINDINAEAAAPFNLGNTNPASSPVEQVIQSTGGVRLNTGTSNATNLGYLVARNGTIDFPVLGNIKVQGLTILQLKDSIRSKLDKYLKEPIINARLLNYKVTVLGEVLRPSTYSIPSERITVVDALGMAGDLTIYGKRENVLLVREENGERKFIRLNLNSSNIFQSPYYYLKQNDIIYVEPNSAKVETSEQISLRRTTVIISILSLLLAAISLFK